VTVTPSAEPSGLFRQLHHRFCNPDLLRTALTHRSAGGRNNERLEFLGDSLLGFIIAEELFRRFPDADEGQLTRLRSSLVKRDTLARVARSIELGAALVLGEGELRSGGWRRESILANALEAVVGAVYMDAGLDACRVAVISLYGEELERASPDAVEKDAKTRLQEFLQERRLPLPSYELVRVEGEAHRQVFTVQCRVLLPEAASETACGTSRRRAEQAAAERLLDRLAGAGGGGP
jgi:ribonuclease-3